MAYPPRHLTFNEMLKTLTAQQVSLVRSTRTKLVSAGGDIVVPGWYLWRQNYAPYGIVPLDSGSIAVTWQTLRAIAAHFELEAELFGLTAGWPSAWADPVV